MAERLWFSSPSMVPMLSECESLNVSHVEY